MFAIIRQKMVQLKEGAVTSWKKNMKRGWVSALSMALVSLMSSSSEWHSMCFVSTDKFSDDLSCTSSFGIYS